MPERSATPAWVCYRFLVGYYATGHQIEAYDGRMVYLAREGGGSLVFFFFCAAGRSALPVASYRFSRYVLLRPMILKRDARTHN